MKTKEALCLRLGEARRSEPDQLNVSRPKDNQKRPNPQCKRARPFGLCPPLNFFKPLEKVTSVQAG
jgi:hypothetical protein